MKDEKLTHDVLLSALEYCPSSGIFRWKPRVTITRHDRTWNSRYSGKIAGSVDNHGYLRIAISDIRYKAHRLAWFYMTGKWPEGVIDHINRNRLDNSFFNLRDVDGSINARNKGKITENSSGEFGIWWRRDRNKWRVSLPIYGEYQHIGNFDDIELALLVRDAACEKYQVAY